MTIEETLKLGSRIVSNMEQESAPDISDVIALFDAFRKGTNLSYYLTQLKRNIKLNKAPRGGWAKKSKRLKLLLEEEGEISLKAT